jgi:hypothetical protein
VKLLVCNIGKPDGVIDLESILLAKNRLKADKENEGKKQRTSARDLMHEFYPTDGF